MDLRLSEKGQATIMDAILFLLVCSALATTLFYFTVSYGAEQEEQLNDRYLRSYASSVYKALLWSPVVREGGFADYLLAYAKEKGSDKEIVKQKFAENLYKLNMPINTSRDYLFAVYDGSQGIGEPFLIVYKEGTELFYCKDASAVGDDAGATYYDDGTNLTTFIDSANSLTSTEGLVTFDNRVLKTILLTWPQGINTVYDIDNNSQLGDHLCSIRDNGQIIEIVLPGGHPDRSEYTPEPEILPQRVVEVDVSTL